jgi:hypothetical protein
MRLHAVSPDRIQEDLRLGFEEPNAVDVWRAYLRDLHRAHTPGYAFGHVLSSNLGHRLQLLEFETALLLHRCDTMRNNNHASLHVCVLVLKIHQHVVLCHSILEGIGSHLKRHLDRQAGRQVNPEWRAAILNSCFSGLNRVDRALLLAEFEGLTARRDKIHLDAVNPLARMHYHDFDVKRVFIPTYNLFKRTLSTMNAQLPAGTCLNEVV